MLYVAASSVSYRRSTVQARVSRDFVYVHEILSDRSDMWGVWSLGTESAAPT